jgi:hypothetical protein
VVIDRLLNEYGRAGARESFAATLEQPGRAHPFRSRPTFNGFRLAGICLVTATSSPRSIPAAARLIRSGDMELVYAHLLCGELPAPDEPRSFTRRAAA